MATPVVQPAGGQAGSHHGHFIAPVRLLLTTLAWLVALTVLTVLTGTADLGPLNGLHVPLALGIAGFKTYKVVAHFMGLKHDNRVNTLAFMLAGVFVTIFLTFTILDMANRGDLGNTDQLTVADREYYGRQLESGGGEVYERLINGSYAGLTTRGDSAEADAAVADSVSVPGDSTAALAADTTATE